MNMKAIKISLAVTVIAAIAFFTIRSLVIINPPLPPPVPKNQFTKRIEMEIDSLGKLPDSNFCNEEYDNIKFFIDDYYNPHPPQYPYGRLGNTQLENDEWKEILTINLYSAYADKFIKQAFYVFRGSNWEFEDLRFIRNEYQTLRSSSLLQRDTPVDKDFTKIQSILSKYDEIADFISTSNGFSYSASGLSDRFPISEVDGKISRAKTYQNNHLENGYVNNCTRLRNGLKEIPQALFRAHVRYLDNKVTYWSGFYSNYISQSDYANNLYRPLKSEIEALDNETYNVANFDNEYQRLLDKWSADNTKAYNYQY